MIYHSNNMTDTFLLELLLFNTVVSPVNCLHTFIKEITDLSFWKRRRPFSMPGVQSAPLKTSTTTTPKPRDRDSLRSPTKRLYTFIHFSAIRPGAAEHESQADDRSVRNTPTRNSGSGPIRDNGRSRASERDARAGGGVQSGEVATKPDRPLSRLVQVR